MSSSNLLALVKWIGGKDDKQYTVGLPIEWIKGFDLAEFRSTRFDPSLSFVVEWHGNKSKPPPGGWPVFDAYVIEVSDRRSVLEKKMSSLDGILSPEKNVTPHQLQKSDDNEQSDKENRSNVINDCNDKRSMAANHTLSPIASCSTTEVNVDQRVAKTKKRKHQVTFEINSNLHERGQSDVSGCAPLISKHKKRNLWPRHPEENNDIARTLTDIQKEMRKIRKQKCSKRDSSSAESSDDEMVEIGEKGSGIFITSDQWRTAKSASTPTAMGINLLLSLFPMKVLLRSNLRGGASKTNKAQNAVRYKGLNKNVLASLYYQVRKHWKNFNSTLLGISINNKLSHLRKLHTKRQAIEEQGGDTESEEDSN